MTEKIKKGIEKFVKASPSTKILFLFSIAIILGVLVYSIFMLLIVK